MTTPIAPLAQADAAATARPEPATHTRHRWWFAIGYGLSLGFLLLALALAAATVVVPKISGAVPLTVLSNSMAPSMPVGSLAIVKPTMNLAAGTDASTLSPAQIRKINHTDQLTVGDVIAYQPKASDGTVIMHRITRVTVHADHTREFITQGDNNAVADQPVQDYMVRGEVWYHLPYLGYVNNYLNSDASRHTILIVIIATAGYAWAAVLIARALRRPKPLQEAGAARD